VELGPLRDDAYTPTMSTTFWNDRYSGDDLVYGAAPNDFRAWPSGFRRPEMP
jgi:hypothetical protein